jgi:uncharacterized protein with GYD domain
MPTHITLTRSRGKALTQLMRIPIPSRPSPTRLRKLGCKVVAEYAVLGQYDFVTMVDARTTRRWLISASISVHTEPPGSRRSQRSR